LAAALLAVILGRAPAAELVLQSPEPARLAFSAHELDVYAQRTWRDRLAHEATAGYLGCRRHCERISAVFARLTRAASRVAGVPALRWQLAIGTNPKEAAWALAGGRMYVSEAFIDEYSMNDDELAFVIGHEMAHALLQHENEALTVAAAFVPRAVAQSVQNLYDAMGADLGLMLKLQPELQAEEFEADRAGMLLAGTAGFDPEGALQFLSALARKDDHAQAIVTTHPQSSERYARAYAVKPSAQVLREYFSASPPFP
jgi:predicted Zn-dependent protease